MDRRSFLQRTAWFGLAATGAASAARAETLKPTPTEIEGPFYPVVVQADRDFDLTRVAGRAGRAQGTVLQIQGRVVDTDGAPVPGATVDLWQANAAGRYRHPHDSNPAPLDPDFQGWAIVASGADGGFRFTTVMPGAYPAGRDWDRPPHIHFKVSKRGYVELTTQMYFAGQALNAKDLLLKRIPEAERGAMIASPLGEPPADAEGPVYRYQIVLQKA